MATWIVCAVVYLVIGGGFAWQVWWWIDEGVEAVPTESEETQVAWSEAEESVAEIGGLWPLMAGAVLFWPLFLPHVIRIIRLGKR